MRRLGAEVKSHRLNAGLTQQALASQIGMTKSYICHLERGTSSHPPTKDVLKRLASVLNGDLGRWELLAGRLPSTLNREVLEQILAMGCSAEDVTVRVERRH